MGAVKEIDHGWNRITKELRSFESSFVKVGVLSTAKSYEGSFHNIVDVATANEYGTSRIPERPFMRQTFEKNHEKVKKILERQYLMIIEGKSDVMKALGYLGEWYTKKIKIEFIDGNFKPNAPSTLLRHWRKHFKGVLTKGEALENESGFGPTKRPLIDTGHLRQSINYEMTIRGGL